VICVVSRVLVELGHQPADGDLLATLESQQLLGCEYGGLVLLVLAVRCDDVDEGFFAHHRLNAHHYLYLMDDGEEVFLWGCGAGVLDAVFQLLQDNRLAVGEPIAQPADFGVFGGRLGFVGAALGFLAAKQTE
jgi:hypothetical protein